MPQTSPFPHQPLWAHVLRECMAMAKYAFAAGMKVPPDLIAKLRELEESVGLDGSEGKPKVAQAKSSSSKGRPTKGESKSDGISEVRPVRAGTKESNRKSAKDSGANTVPKSAKTSAQPDVQRLATVHNRLSELVAPATPKTILLLATEEAKGGFLLFLGAVPLVRRLMAVAVASMVGFVAVSLSDQVNGNGFDLLQNSGATLLLSEMFLLFAASIGASFSNLFEAQRYIKDGTFDPKFESSYWVRYVLGLMAGTILALLIPIEALAGGGDGSGSSMIDQLGKPILALLGGFAAAAVYRILNRIVAALESLVAGDTRDLVAAEEAARKVRAAERETQSRMNLSLKLITLQEQLETADDPAAVRTELKRIQQQLIKGEDEEAAILDPATANSTSKASAEA